MRRWVWRVLLAALVLAALTVGVFAADSVTIDWTEMEDGNFIYKPIYVSGSTNSRENIKAYQVQKYIGEERKEVAVPDRFHGKPVTEIGVTTTDLTTPSEAQLKAASVFADSKLEGSVSIPNSITAINSGAFSYARMTGVVIPGSVETIGTYAFAKCSNLVDIQILDYADDNGDIYPSHTTIKDHAFEDCGYIKSLSIPNSVATINDSAFKGCSGLIDLILPYSVKEIKTKAFADCRNLLNVTILASNVEFADDSFEWKDIFAAKDSKPGGYFHCAYSDTVTNIGAKIDKLGLKSSTAKAYKARVHTVTMQNDGLTVTGRTTPLCKASGTNGKATLSFTCGGYNETVQKVDEAGKPVVDDQGNAVMETVHKDCTCYGGKNSYSESRDVSAVYHDERPVLEVVDPTCVTAGRKGGTRCAICGNDIEPPETTPATGDHTYDEDSKTVERPLFEGYCGDGSKGLILVTKTCSVCGSHTPTCWTCQKLEWELAKADAALAAAQEAYDEAKANEDKAVKALEDANAAKTAADAAVTEAVGEVAKAQAAADDAEAKLGALGDTATEEERAAAEKALDDANEALLDAKMAEDAAKKTAAAAGDAVTKAQEEKDAATEALTNPTDLAAALTKARSDASAQKTELTNHVKLTAAGSHRECPTCNELRKAIDTATGSAKKKAEQAYQDHFGDAAVHPSTLKDMTPAVSTKETDKVAHAWGKEYEVVKTPAICGTTILGEKEIRHECTVCGDDELVETITTRPAKKHTPDPSAEAKTIKAATCTEEGIRGYEPDVKCATCRHEIGEGFTEPIPALKHDMVHDETKDIIVEATCTTPGSKTEVWVCSRGEKCSEYKDGKPYSEEKNSEPIPALGHTWGDFTPNEGQDMTPNETCESKEVTGKVKCTVCGVEEEHTLTIEGLGKHTWGEWKADEDGKTETRTCSVCGETETKDVAAPEPPDEPDDPDDPDDPDKPDKPTEPDTPKSYSITVVPGAGGAASASRSTAQSGDTVTLTISASSGYELDMIRAIRGGVSVVSLTDLGGGQYRFTMPADNVEIRVTFSKKNSSSGTPWASAPGEGASSTDPRRTTDVMPTQNPTQSVPRAGAYEQLFQDIPTNHWAAGEINWANQMGYMNGTGGRFNPDGNITHQQMWMVLARLTGNHPANMTEARRWAVEHSFADGSSPTGAVSRHQLVTALYRCAHLMGSANRNTTSLAGYPDSRTVPTVARDAFSWAVANGILGGTANGRLDPNGTLTRAQFAVILYRYSQRI